MVMLCFSRRFRRVSPRLFTLVLPHTTLWAFASADIMRGVKRIGHGLRELLVLEGVWDCIIPIKGTENESDDLELVLSLMVAMSLVVNSDRGVHTFDIDMGGE